MEMMGYREGCGEDWQGLQHPAVVLEREATASAVIVRTLFDSSPKAFRQASVAPFAKLTVTHWPF